MSTLDKLCLFFLLRYLSGYLQGREKAAPQPYQLMGDILEALDEREAAIESYKK